MLLALNTVAGVVAGALIGMNVRVGSLATDSEAAVRALSAQAQALTVPRMLLLGAIVVVAVCLNRALRGPQPPDPSTRRRITAIAALVVAGVVIVLAGASDYTTISAAQRANLLLCAACGLLVAAGTEGYRHLR